MPEPAENEITLMIDTCGTVTFLHDDRLVDLRKHLGDAEIRRASHVEPDSQGNWYADLSPVQGPTLGPYVTRQEALAAEVAWLLEAGIPVPGETPCDPAT